MVDRNEVDHQVWAYVKKVANVTLANPRNQQKWVFLYLTMQIYSPWCPTWCCVIIWGLEHVHKIWDQKETVGNVELLKFGSGQRGFWNSLVRQNNWDWDETLQDHQIWQLWLAGIFLEFIENISYRNISKAWFKQKGFWGVLPMILNMTMCWNSYIWKMCVHWVSLNFLKYFWNIKIIFPYKRPILALRKGL